MSGLTTAPNIKALRLYVSYWRNYKVTTFFSAAFSLVLALQYVVVPLLIAMALGDLIEHKIINTGLLIFMALFQVALVAAGYVLDGWAVASLHTKVAEKLYNDSFRYLVHQD